MYTILITASNELIISQRERIMHRSKLVDTLHFLADPIYKEADMSSFAVYMEYVLPVSKEYHSEILTLSDELYKDKLEYKIPFDTALTKEAGDVELQLTFLKTELDADGNQIQYVRKISPAAITIIPVAAWSDFIPDNSLSSIDQRILKTESMIHAMEDLSQQLIDNYDSKADNLSLEGNDLQLVGNGKKIGDKVTLSNTSVSPDDDGNIRVVDF